MRDQTLNTCKQVVDPWPYWVCTKTSADMLCSHLPRTAQPS